MSSNVSNTMPYLRATRQFPSEINRLTQELTRAWNELAVCVNARDIAIYNLTPIITGQLWFSDQSANEQGNIPQRQALRQVYSKGNFTAFSHNIANPNTFVSISGTFTDGTSWYPLPYVNATAANQVGLYCSSTQVIFSVGGGAPSPTGVIIVLEYLLN
ncbi:hypothetical protein UFOVP255_2 [uncultured Caudovirales phage]|uniref:Uncharacterized protein n=1 Tax=uncultured Caudovirales phage TaxID=2100421 RepID=A0A6J5LDP5_9CAUD|nr:hypothetical protein UFOVP255_2 [uncultured Caudovirales phage]